jgi:hypothetical protein
VFEKLVGKTNTCFVQIIDLTWIKKAPAVVGQGLRLNNARVITTVSYL